MKKSCLSLTILIVDFICCGTDKSIAKVGRQFIEDKIPSFLRQGILVEEDT